MTTNLQYWLLRHQDLFNTLKEEEFKKLCAGSTFKRLKKDVIIYPHTHNIEQLYVLNQGRIKIAYHIQKNEEVVSEILKEEDLFGEMTLKIAENRNHEFAQVLSDEALVSAFRIADFENALKNNSAFALAYSQMVAEKLKIISGKYRELVHKDVRSRVLNFFMLHAQYEGKWTGNKAEIDMFCTHQDIANFTASRRQTVSTIIRDLVKENKIIYKGRSKVIIPDVKKLNAE